MTSPRPIYLDYQATTPIDPRVRELMTKHSDDGFGNPHSTSHRFGWEAAEAVADARAQVAELLGAGDDEIIFTSGATESCNIALRGAARATESRNEIVTLATEHPAVLETVRDLEKDGVAASIVPVRSDGIVDLEQVRVAVSERTAIVSAMLVNNEIGVIQPIAGISDIAHEHGALMHTDATQAPGRMMFDVDELGVDLLTISSHKVYGPMGIGALYVRDTSFRRVAPIMTGGGQERWLRPGTVPAPAVAGFGEACRLALEETEADSIRVYNLAAKFWRALKKSFPEVRLNGNASQRVAGNLNMTFPRLSADEIIANMQDEVAISTGSACSSKGGEPSHVLAAISDSPYIGVHGVRISIGRFTTEEEIDRAVAAFRDNLPNIRVSAADEVAAEGAA